MAIFAAMAQKKLQRFADIKTFSNVLEYPQDIQGKWGIFFNNDNPIVLELACGRGEYTVGLSQLFPSKNFIGVDIKGNRIYIGAKKCLQEQRSNAAFLRTQIALLPNYFAAGEVDEIWLTFPDPQLRISKAKKRLTHPRFLRLYLQLLRPGGYLHLKTDSPVLYQFTKQVIDMYGLQLVEEYDDVYAQAAEAIFSIKTHYEALDIAQSNKIFYLKFQLPAVLHDYDETLHKSLKAIEQVSTIN
jgi:tRNA (guanine-N7-)-methyltransferase